MKKSIVLMTSLDDFSLTFFHFARNPFRGNAPLGDVIPSIHDHHYFQPSIVAHEIPDAIQDHNYFQYTQVQHININMEYADDMSEITSDFNRSVKSEKEKSKKTFEQRTANKRQQN